jgi:hypothetical protein
MPAIQKDCSVFQAFNFRRDVHDKVGHVTELKIGEDENGDMEADLTLRDPIAGDDSSEVKVVGVISSFHWEGGYAQPVQISMQMSRENKKKLAVLLHTTMKSVKVVISYEIYEYDRDAEVFYKSVHTNDNTLNAILQVQGTERVLYLSDTPGTEVENPVNYQLVVGMVPDEEQQEIHIAVSDSAKFVKPWGVTRG